MVLICLFPFLSFLRAVRAEIKAPKADSGDDITTPLFTRTKPLFTRTKPQVPAHLESVTRKTIRDHPQWTGIASSSPAAGTYNLPLPKGNVADDLEKMAVENLEVDDLYETMEKVAEKQRLDVSIGNLKRVLELGGAANHGVRWKLNEAEGKRQNLELYIDDSFRTFNSQKGSWSTEEWAVVEQIMQVYRRRK